MNSSQYNADFFKAIFNSDELYFLKNVGNVEEIEVLNNIQEPKSEPITVIEMASTDPAVIIKQPKFELENKVIPLLILLMLTI